MPKELEKTYNPREMEERIYKFWMDGNFFRAEADQEKEPFTIVIPPPNVTGQLHMGHALDETLQDILIRYKRMQGYAALWLPGTDHAGIATQIKVEETLREEGLSRHDLGREKFLERVWQWKELYGSRIINQLKKLGSSCDWSRERFTMDEGCSKAVREVFVDLYEKGLIYRGNRIINWCPNCITALSDAEVEYQEMDGHFWHIKYPYADGTGYVEIATTRPETMLGDTAVVVHPEDPRYAHLKGKSVLLPLMDREIPVIFDEYVDMEFGTGAMKVTPCHDPNDFELGKKHGLEEIKVMDDHGNINELGGAYAGLERYAARKKIVEDLEKLGLLVKAAPHAHNVGSCYRCHTVVEPITSKQWFVKMSPLATAAIDVVENGEVKFVPERFSKTYLNWMENVHDWCISRQLWWGHRIPAFYCDACGELTVSKEKVTACPRCGGEVRQDEDVLDTWFSSALWPFSTLGWPDKTEDLEFFYPTSVLVTGYDIIFFWVARMIFSAMEQMGEKPFSHVLIHGLVRDAEGRKMSKSLGNGIDPLEVIEKYGADALRFTLASGNAPGGDMRFYYEKVEAGRNFGNKLWNASRFVLMNLTVSDKALPENLEPEDKWVLSLYNNLVREVNENLDKFELGIALGKLYDFIWDIFCDWYIEIVKPRLFDKEDTAKSGIAAQKVLLFVLDGILRLLHPYMPFITEEIYAAIPHDEESLMISAFPVYDETLFFPAEEEEFSSVLAVIRAIRNKRSELSVAPSKKIDAAVATEKKELFLQGTPFISRLAGVGNLWVLEAGAQPSEGDVVLITAGAKVYLPLGQMVDFEEEKKRLLKEKERLESEKARLFAKLSNEGFLKKAPESVVSEEKKKLEKCEGMLGEVISSLENLK